MYLEDVNYKLWQIISKSKKTLFGYRITVLFTGNDNIKVGDTVYIDNNTQNIHNIEKDITATVQKIAWSNWINHFYHKVDELKPDKTIYNPDMNNPPTSLWVRLWIKTNYEIKEGDIVYASIDK